MTSLNDEVHLRFKGVREHVNKKKIKKDDKKIIVHTSDKKLHIYN